MLWTSANMMSDPDQSTESSAIQPNDSFSSCSRDVVSSTDIHFCLQASLPDEQKYSILKKLWIPGENFAFPASTSRNLRFQHRWFKRFKWLAYSQVELRAFCKYWVLFGNHSGTGRGMQALGALCTKKFDKWKNALEKFKEHKLSQYHRNSLMFAEGLKNVMECRQESVYSQLNVAAKQNAIDNRKRLIPIIEPIILCGRQGLALRGHADAGPFNIKEPVANEGNFRALVRFRIKDNKELQDLFLNTPKNAQYLSPRIQNEIIATCNDLILSNLVKDIAQNIFQYLQTKLQILPARNSYLFASDMLILIIACENIFCNLLRLKDSLEKSFLRQFLLICKSLELTSVACEVKDMMEQLQ